MRLSVALVLAAVLVAARPAQAQGDARLSARLDAATAASVQATIDAAAAEGLPTEPLVLKALEGASKGARAAQIIAVIGRLGTQLRDVRTVLGQRSTAEEIVAGSAALQAGLDASKLRELRDVRPTGSLATALSVLADLLARGVPAETASNAVLELVRTGASDAQLVDYQRRVERDIGAGLLPAAAAMRGPGDVPPAIPTAPGIRPPTSAPPAGGPPTE